MKKIVGILMCGIMMVGMNFTSQAGWFGDSTGIYWHDDNGNLVHGWTWIDDDFDGISECYYFDETGASMMGTIEGYEVNADGMWVENGVVQQKETDTKAKFLVGNPLGRYQNASTGGTAEIMYLSGEDYCDITVKDSQGNIIYYGVFPSYARTLSGWNRASSENIPSVDIYYNNHDRIIVDTSDMDTYGFGIVGLAGTYMKVEDFTLS